MREYNFKASDSTGEMLMGLVFAFLFMGVAGIILTLRLILFPKIKYSSYVDNIYLEKFLIVVPALIITWYIMKLIKKYAIKNYHIYEDKEILKIENDKKKPTMKKIVLLAAALLLAAASFAQSEYNYQKRSLFEQLPIRGNDIVFLGNSITDGGEWAELFNNRHVKNRGISADRSGWLLDRLDPIINGHPKKLFLMIGTNDLAVGIAPEEVAANVEKLLDRFAEESPWTKIYVQSILPVNGVDTKAKPKNHWKKGAEIIETNKLLETLCEGRKNVMYVDVYSALVDEKGMLDKQYTNDGLHLMGEGSLAWKTVIEKFVR